MAGTSPEERRIARALYCRRGRAHRKGDHSLCILGRCEDLGPLDPDLYSRANPMQLPEVIDQPYVCFVKGVSIARCRRCNFTYTRQQDTPHPYTPRKLDAWWEEASYHTCLRATVVRVRWLKNAP